MYAKYPPVSPASGENKKTMAITLKEKLKIIAKYEHKHNNNGIPVMANACEMGLLQSMILTILKYKKEISDAVKLATSTKSSLGEELTQSKRNC